MSKNSHTVDESGFGFMANQGQEEKDRDFCGMYLAIALMAMLTLCQYWDLY